MATITLDASDDFRIEDGVAGAAVSRGRRRAHVRARQGLGVERYMKMAFRVQADDREEDETMWVEEVRPGVYRVDNIPFYMRGVSYNDLVTGSRAAGDMLRYEQTVESGKHSTLRVLVRKGHDVRAARAAFEKAGCGSEGSDTPGLIAVDVPPEVTWETAQRVLKELGDALFDYEEGSISRHHVP